MSNCQITELSQSMNVPKEDVYSLLTTVCADLKADKMVDKFINGSEEFKLEIVEVYVTNAIKKMQEFTATYFRNPEARAEFIKTVKALF